MARDRIIGRGLVPIIAIPSRAEARKAAEEITDEVDRVARRRRRRFWNTILGAGSLGFVQSAASNASDLFFKGLFTPSHAVLQALRTGIPAVLASPVGIAAGTLGLLWAVSFTSAVLGSGALLAIGAGLVGLAAFALRGNEKIKTAFTATGAFLSKALAKVAAPLVPSFLAAFEMIQIIAKERVMPKLAKLFHGIRPVITSLVAMVGGAIDAMLRPMASSRALEGLRTFFVSAQQHVIRLGKFIGEFSAVMMRNGPLISKAFGIVVSTIESVGKVLAVTILIGSGMLLGFAAVWNKVWGVIKSVTDKIYGAVSKLGPVFEIIDAATEKFDKRLRGTTGAAEEMDPELKKLMESIQNMSFGLGGLNRTTTTTIQKFDEVTQKAQSLFGKFMSVDQATANATTTIMGLKDALDKNGRSLDVNTLSGAKNRTAILNAVQAAEQQRRAMRESGLSIAYVDGVMKENIKRIYGQARAAGANEEALRKLLGKYYDLVNAPNIHKVIKLEGQKIGDQQVFEIAGTGIKFFQHGGRIAARQLAVVGEKGPELFVPNKAGMILPNDAMKWFKNPQSNTTEMTFPGRKDTEKTANKMINITQNITTQEIDPRVHASQLGWEIAGRLR